MKHYMKLRSAPFEAIRSGRKTFELRLWDAKRRLVEPGDVIEFARSSDKKDTLRTRVLALHRFPDFAALYAAIPLEKCGYSPQELPTASPDDMTQYYSEAEQRQYGVVAIELELISADSGERTAVSKFLSLVLRHKPQAADVTLDEHGWCDVESLILGTAKKYPGFDRAFLEAIVAEDEKQRYSFSPDGRMIRANQGHSVPVRVELEEREPPAFLWHGTAARFLDSIMNEGLRPGTRTHVHMTEDRRLALQSGLRHGDPVALRVDAGRMFREGYRFFLSANSVWLTEYVPPCYIDL